MTYPPASFQALTVTNHILWKARAGIFVFFTSQVFLPRRAACDLHHSNRNFSCCRSNDHAFYFNYQNPMTFSSSSKSDCNIQLMALTSPAPFPSTSAYGKFFSPFTLPLHLTPSRCRLPSEAGNDDIPHSAPSLTTLRFVSTLVVSYDKSIFTLGTACVCTCLPSVHSPLVSAQSSLTKRV